jgi:DNA-binding transcriptional MerR regulator
MPSDDSNIPAEEITLEGRPQLRADRAVSDTERQLLQGAIEDAERDMPLAIDLGLYARLDAEQIRAIREPWTVLGGTRRREYPLNTGELARITSTSPKQIRTWEESGLLPAYWIAGRRHFFSAALVYAFLLKDLDRHEIRGARRILSAEPNDPIPELVASAIEHSQHNGHPARLATLLTRRR